MKSKRFANLDFSDRALGPKTKRFSKLDFAEVARSPSRPKFSMRFHAIGQDEFGHEDPYRLYILRARESQSHSADKPELRLEVSIPARDAHNKAHPKNHLWGFSWKGTYDHREWLLANRLWRVLDVDSNGYWFIMGHNGPFAHAQRVKPDPEGKHKVLTNRGPIRYSSYLWDKNIHSYTKRQYVELYWNVEGCGNVQYGWVEANVVRQAIEEYDLNFAVVDNGYGARVDFTGPMDAIREYRVWKRYGTGPLYGLTFYSKPNKFARTKETWGGAHWPSESAATKAGRHFKKTGETDVCANLDQLRKKFPRSPVLKPAHRGMTKEQLQAVCHVHDIKVPRYPTMEDLYDALGIPPENEEFVYMYDDEAEGEYVMFRIGQYPDEEGA
jgi:hypothetical protein